MNYAVLINEGKTLLLSSLFKQGLNGGALSYFMDSPECVLALKASRRHSFPKF